VDGRSSDVCPEVDWWRNYLQKASKDLFYWLIISIYLILGPKPVLYRCELWGFQAAKFVYCNRHIETIMIREGRQLFKEVAPISVASEVNDIIGLILSQHMSSLFQTYVFATFILYLICFKNVLIRILLNLDIFPSSILRIQDVEVDAIVLLI
jgi:hypothetical protein